MVCKKMILFVGLNEKPMKTYQLNRSKKKKNRQNFLGNITHWKFEKPRDPK